jgi:hypothetical protein
VAIACNVFTIFRSFAALNSYCYSTSFLFSLYEKHQALQNTLDFTLAVVVVDDDEISRNEVSCWSSFPRGDTNGNTAHLQEAYQDFRTVKSDD